MKRTDLRLTAVEKKKNSQLDKAEQIHLGTFLNSTDYYDDIRTPQDIVGLFVLYPI